MGMRFSFKAAGSVAAWMVGVVAFIITAHLALSALKARQEVK
jgi:hypothetical protein